MSGGTWIGPAGPLTAATVGAIRLPPLAAAIAVALALHASLLAIRPGGLTGSHVAPAAKAMAVRIVRPLAAPEPAAAVAEPAVVGKPAVEAERSPTTVPGERGPRLASSRSVKPAREAAAEPGVDGSARRGAEATSGQTPSPAAMPSSAETALPAAPDYALGVRLDPGPRPLDDIEPEYPDVHLREGTVVLRLLISDKGHVDNVAVVRSEPRGVFEQAALEAFGKARFSPGLAAGTPVKSQITVEVRFVPINRGARVSGRTY